MVHCGLSRPVQLVPADIRKRTAVAPRPDQEMNLSMSNFKCRATRSLIVGGLLAGLCGLSGCGEPSRVGTVKISPKESMKIGESVQPASAKKGEPDSPRSIKNRPPKD